MDRTLRRLQIQKQQYQTSIMQAEEDVDAHTDSIAACKKKMAETETRVVSIDEQITKRMKELGNGNG